MHRLTSLTHFTTIAEVENHLLATLQEWQEEGHEVAYVAGVIFSDGPEEVRRNIANLNKHTDIIRKQSKGKVFSAADIFFNTGIVELLDTAQLLSVDRRARFFQFWRTILAGGVNKIYMSPGWTRSEGAQDEHACAQELGIIIHYLEEE